MVVVYRFASGFAKKICNCANLRPRYRQTSTTNFLDCPLDLCASALSHQSINPVRGSQIGKTKLSVRKAQERNWKEGQEGRKLRPLRSISAYGGDEVSHYDQTRKDNSLENNRFASLLISYPWTSPRGTDAGQSSNKGHRDNARSRFSKRA